MNNTMITEYLQQIGLTDKERSLYLMLAQMGVQPASIVAKKCKLDRVTAYKNLKKMAEKGFVKIYYQNGIQSFGIESFSHLRYVIEDQQKNLKGLDAQFPLVESLLKSMGGEHDFIPKLQIFEGETGIKNLLRDMLIEIEDNNLHQIRMLASNTFEERLGDVKLSAFVSDFFNTLKKNHVDLEIFEASGTLIPEVLRRVEPSSFDPEKLPAARGTTNIFIAGQAVYIACYKTSQIALKIKHQEISQTFHFLFDVVGRRVGEA